MKQNRKNWSHQEDQTILNLVRKFGTKRWTLISDKMRERFPDDGRSGKQCRERWHNHLSPIINKQPWSQEEIKLVFDTHRKFGNKWTQIAQLLPGRTDNSVKNQFYSTLRKGLRRICKILGTRNSTTRIKKIKPTALSSLISNFTQINIGDGQSQEELYDLLFEFSNGDRYEEFKEKEVSEKYKEKMEKLLQKILDSKDVGKRRRIKSSIKNVQNVQIDNQNQAEIDVQSQKQKQEEFNQAKEETNKFEFNVVLDDNQQLSPDVEVSNNQENQLNVHDEPDSRLQKPISLKRQNSLAESLKDQQNLPVFKKKQSYEYQRHQKRNQLYAQPQNSQNYFKNFLSKSPNFSSRFKMPTPRLQDGYSNPIFSYNADHDHRDDEPVEKYCNFVVEEVRANIKANAQGRGDREHRLR